MLLVRQDHGSARSGSDLLLVAGLRLGLIFLQEQIPARQESPHGPPPARGDVGQFAHDTGSDRQGPENRLISRDPQRFLGLFNDSRISPRSRPSAGGQPLAIAIIFRWAHAVFVDSSRRNSWLASAMEVLCTSIVLAERRRHLIVPGLSVCNLRPIAVCDQCC